METGLMESLIDTLPGVYMPVAEISSALAQMWQGEQDETKGAPSEFRAVQMNLVLHFGLNTKSEMARTLFDRAILFAQKYPCRVIVLCPQNKRDPEALMQAKLFTQCYVGASFREMCCCEALILGYNPSESEFLGNQISLWMEPGLPRYYWLHGVPASVVERNYMPFLEGCRRVVYDSAVEGDSYSQIFWSKPEAVRDLEAARGLPARQALGQFLSAVSPKVLVDGLQQVRQRCALGHEGQARHLLKWQQECIEGCCQIAGIRAETIRFDLEPVKDLNPGAIQLIWNYEQGEKFFRCNRPEPNMPGDVTADFGQGTFSHQLLVPDLAEEKVLGEAFFF